MFTQKTSTFCLIFTFFVSLTISVVNGHNWLVNPVSRANQRDTQTGCRYGGEGNPTCAGPCDRTLSQTTRAPISVQRGQTLDIQWNRHNHPGGFIRFAWSPTSQSDSHASFDSYVDHFVCKDSGGCGPTDPSNPTGTPNGLNCAASITVPLWLTNGAWTLQWAYFGGWYNAGDYYACVDYTITGGPTATRGSPYFTGGDATYPNQQKCLFYSTNALHVCTVEPCLNGTFPAGAQSGAPLMANAPVPTPPTPIPSPPTPTPVPTPTPPATPATTRAATTRKVTTSPLTSGRVASASTTGAQTPTPVPTPTPLPPAPTPTPAPIPPSSSPCSLGQQRCSGTNTFQTCSWATQTVTGWSPNQVCPTGLQCHSHPVYPDYIWCY